MEDENLWDASAWPLDGSKKRKEAFVHESFSVPRCEIILRDLSLHVAVQSCCKKQGTVQLLNNISCVLEVGRENSSLFFSPFSLFAPSQARLLH